MKINIQLEGKGEEVLQALQLLIGAQLEDIDAYSNKTIGFGFEMDEIEERAKKSK